MYNCYGGTSGVENVRRLFGLSTASDHRGCSLSLHECRVHSHAKSLRIESACFLFIGGRRIFTSFNERWWRPPHMQYHHKAQEEGKNKKKKRERKIGRDWRKKPFSLKASHPYNGSISSICIQIIHTHTHTLRRSATWRCVHIDDVKTSADCMEIPGHHAHNVHKAHFKRENSSN